MSRRAICILTTAVAVALVLFEVSFVRADDVSTLLERRRPPGQTGCSKPDRCPADLMPTHEIMFDFSLERCSAETAGCLDRCRSGDAADCYATAIVFQRVKDKGKVATPSSFGPVHWVLSPVARTGPRAWIGRAMAGPTRRHATSTTPGPAR